MDLEALKEGVIQDPLEIKMEKGRRAVEEEREQTPLQRLRKLRRQRRLR